MKTIFLFFLTIYIAYYLFRPVTQKEIKNLMIQIIGQTWVFKAFKCSIILSDNACKS